MRFILRTCGAVIGLVCWMGGCATVPAYLFDPKGSPHPECLPSTHMAAVGRSTADAADAERSARAALARQIRSRIQVEAERITTTLKESGVISSQRALNQSVVERAEFAHGELFETVGPPGSVDGTYLVLVCLERARATEILLAELQEPLARFEQLQRDALQGFDEHDAMRFTMAFQESSELAPRLLQQFSEIRAIDGDTSWAERKFQDAYRSLVVTATKLRGQTQVALYVAPEQLPEEHLRHVGATFRQVLTGLGLGTSMSTEGDCTQNPGRYLVTVKGSEGCQWTSLGHYCKPRFAVEAYRCGRTDDGHRVVSVKEIEDEAWRGNHARDKTIALRRAFQHLRSPGLEQAMMSLFHGELPLPPANTQN